MELYCSTDIEADGPIPGDNSMLSFGTAVFDIDGNLIDTFARNLETLPQASADEATMAWWAKHPRAYEATRIDPVDARNAMNDYAGFLDRLGHRPVMMAYPGGYDFMWMHWYLMHFVGRNPYGHSVLCVKSYAMAVLGTEFRRTVKRSMPPQWFSKTKHAHVALTDAIEQGELGIKMIRSQRGLDNK